MITLITEFVPTALLAAIIAGIVVLVRRRRTVQFEIDGAGPGVARNGATRPDVPRPEWERFFVYALSFAGLMAVLFALSGFVALAVGLAIQYLSTLGTLIGSADARMRASYYLAALLVGVPIWLGSWQLVRRRVRRSPDERNALERRLFLAATFGVTSIVGLFALQAVLEAVLTLPGAVDQLSVARNGVIAAAQLLVYGAAWIGYARLGWHERSPRASDVAHDLAVYALTGCALVLFMLGVGDALRHAIMALQGTSETLFGSTNTAWTTWGPITSFLVAGGLIWGAVWGYDLWRAGARALRVGYLYLVLAVSVPMAAIAGWALFSESLRRAFGYQDFSSVNNWSFIADIVPVLVIGGALWAYHWIVVRDQAALFDLPAVKGVVWPRRPAIAALSLSGLTATTVSCVSCMWLLIDWLLTTHGAADGGAWWRDQLSLSLAGVAVGAAIWLPAWMLLQRAAAADPSHERTSWERRWLLGAIVLGSALAAAAFTVAMLYQLFRGILQTTDANTLSDGLRYGSALIVAVAVGTYHVVVFRRDREVRARRSVQLRLAALVTPGAEPMLDELRRRLDRPIELLGSTTADSPWPVMDRSALQRSLSALEQENRIDRALLVLSPVGGIVLPYTRPGSSPPLPPSESRPQEVPAAPRESPKPSA
jgi:hypothetical protein